jgi:hypothetical protein
VLDLAMAEEHDLPIDVPEEPASASKAAGKRA